MSNFIYYENLEQYEEQVRKAKLCDKKDKEIERLNNIINELEKWVEKTDNLWCLDCTCLSDVLDKIKELKEKYNV